MTANDAAEGASRVFFDAAPVIYAVEGDPRYQSRVDPFFDRLKRRELTGVVTPVTVAECLVLPERQRDHVLYETFVKLLEPSRAMRVIDVTPQIAADAVRLRVHYGLHLLDAFQMAAAIRGGVDLFLTNDKMFRRVTELNIVLVDDLEELASTPEQAAENLDEAE
jgi:predicted nucleic acid-binding protein